MSEVDSLNFKKNTFSAIRQPVKLSLYLPLRIILAAILKIYRHFEYIIIRNRFLNTNNPYVDLLHSIYGQNWTDTSLKSC